MKSVIHKFASSMVPKRSGYFTLYFKVLNNDSEYGLSLLTLGLENEGITCNLCRVDSIVAPFMGEPLSECRYNPFRSVVLPISAIIFAASSEFSSLCTLQPAIIR